jgi:hypothetical protein
MDASWLEERMQKTAITGACLHGKAGYQQSQWRWRYLAPYLIGRTRRDHERAQWHRGQPGLERKERGEYQQTAWQRPTRPIAGQHRSARAARRWHSAAYPVILTLSFRVVVQPSAHKIASLGKRKRGAITRGDLVVCDGKRTLDTTPHPPRPQGSG